MKTMIKLAVILLCVHTSISINAQSENSYGSIDNNALSTTNDNEVKAEIIITESKTKRGYKNLEFKLSNGMIFTYEDGNYKAGYKTKSLEVKGQYSITSEVGTLSLAFNADDGSIWWVFRKK